jgi:hypothetical protein
MKNYAWIAQCRICGQGRLMVARENATGVLFVFCEECESEWESPADTLLIEKAFRDRFGPATILEREDLVGHEWEARLARL